MWDERYATETYVFGREPAQFVRRHAHLLVPGQRVLAIADGEGRNGVFLAGRGLDVVSMDGSAVALEKARALADEKGVALEIVQADIASWTWQEAAFDVVLGVFIQFMEPELRKRVFEGMKRTVKPGGLILLHGYTPEQIAHGTGGPRVPENLYTEALLSEAFADFEIEELASYEAEIKEGEGHKGLSALIDLVVRRPIA